MLKIHYSPESRRDLDDIWDYIVLELQNRSAAERVINRIIDAVDPLKNFAEMGSPLSSIADVGTDYRFLVSGNYMVFYRVQGCDVYIDRVLYGRSDYMSVHARHEPCLVRNYIRKVIPISNNDLP